MALVDVRPRRERHLSNPSVFSLRVSDVMTPDPECVSPDHTVAQALEIMTRRNCRHLPVLDQGRLVGIVSNRDLVGHSGPAPLRERATVTPVMIRPDARAEVAAGLMMRKRINSILVVRQGRLVGIVTSFDLLDSLAQQTRSSYMIRPGGVAARGLAEYMTPDPRTISGTTSAGEARKLMQSCGIRHLPVVDAQGAVCGMISSLDVASPLRDALDVSCVMSRRIERIHQAESLDVAAAKMAVRKINSLLVFDGDRLVGILTTHDLLKAFVDLLEDFRNSSLR